MRGIRHPEELSNALKRTKSCGMASAILQRKIPKLGKG